MVFLIILYMSVDCIKAYSQYQSKHNNNVRFVWLIKGIIDWLINLNITLMDMKI